MAGYHAPAGGCVRNVYSRSRPAEFRRLHPRDGSAGMGASVARDAAGRVALLGLVALVGRAGSWRWAAGPQRPLPGAQLQPLIRRNSLERGNARAWAQRWWLRSELREALVSDAAVDGGAVEPTAGAVEEQPQATMAMSDSTTAGYGVFTLIPEW